MRIFVLAACVLFFLAVLWGPALYLTRKYMLRGVIGLWPWLRFVLPAQLVATIVLTIWGDFTGRWDLAPIVVVSTLAASAVGAALVAVLQLTRRRI